MNHEKAFCLLPQTAVGYLRLAVSLLALACVGYLAWGTDSKQGAFDLSALSEQGVVVEELVQYGEAEQSGLQEGDVLLFWSRGDAKGEIHSPFDLVQIEVEEAPLGKVMLRGRRGPSEMAWSLGCAPWQVMVRPNFAGEPLSSYRKGRKLNKTGNAADAVQAFDLWKVLAARFSRAQAPREASWLLFQAAESLRNIKQWKEADDSYQAALQYAANSDPIVEAQLLRAWATAYQQRSDWANAKKYFQQAISTDQSKGRGTFAEASSLDALGDISTQRGDLGKAEEYCRQALQIQEKLASESLPLAVSLHCLGSVAYEHGNLTEAEKNYQRAFEIRNKLAPESIPLAASYASLGIVAWQRGNLSQWDKNEHHALEIRKKLAPGSYLVAASLNNLGMIGEARGDLVKAERYYHQSLDLKQKLVPGSLSVVGGLINLGNVEGTRGDLDRAEQHYRLALEMQQRLAPGSHNVAALFGNLGKLEQYRGNPAKAEQYYLQALEIQQKIAPGSLRVATSFNDLGEVADQRGDLAAATQYYDQSIAIKQKLAPQSLSAAQTIYGLGNVARKSGDFATAERYYRQALSIREKLVPGSTVHGESLAAVASVMRDRHQLEAAAQFYAQAIGALESQFSRLGGSEQVRSGFSARHLEIYKAYVDLLLAQKQPGRALEVLERSRARILLEALAAAHIDIRKGADPSLLERERSLREFLETNLDRRLRLLGRENAERQSAEIAEEVDNVEKQYEELEEELRLSSPVYAALTQPQPLALSEIQQLLDGDTVLIEYSLGEERSRVFAVTHQSLAVHELPGRAEMESDERRLYELLTTRNRVVQNEKEETRRVRIAKSDTEYRDAALALSRVLIDPLAPDLGHKRVVVVADGALQYISFAALSEPPQSCQSASDATYVPLITHHEILELPSVSILAVLRRERSNRVQPVKQVMVVADPVFDEKDSRVKPPVHSGHGDDNRAVEVENGVVSDPSDSNSVRDLTRSLADIGMNRGGEVSLPRLPFTRREAADIMALTPKGMGTQAVDFDAKRNLAISGGLGGYRIVHFATHALVDNQHPELSGLVLSLVDRRGNRQNGFLNLQDIYNLDLNADLVVLSACDTALGKQVDGEGMIGLTRGFMYAGAQGVVGTLWKVQDFATAKFMSVFYQAMEQDGKAPAEAMRQAQLALLKDKNWSSPYYWAAFTLHGDWRMTEHSLPPTR